MKRPRSYPAPGRRACGVFLALVFALVEVLAGAGRASAQPSVAPSVALSVAPSSEPAPAGAPVPSSEPDRVAAPTETSVRLLDRKVFAVRVPRGNQSPEERAQAAGKVLDRAAQEEEIPEVRVDERGDVAVIYVGTSPLIQLGPEDAAAAGDASLGVHAAAIAGTVRDFLSKEHSRSRAAKGVFAFSLIVFSGLMALLLLRRVREIVEKARGWVAEHPERLPVLRVGEIEVLRPAAFKGALSVALGGVRVLAQIGIVYGWLLFALSRYDVTAGYSERLTDFVLSPVSALMGRLAGALPVLVIALFAALGVLLLVRFTGLFFGSVARGETALGWLPPDLAVPTGVLVRAGIVVAALVLTAPLVTGVEEGALTRAGVVALVSLGLASTPLLASTAAGVAVVYGRRVRVGDVADIGGRSGRVREVSLLEVRLEDEDGCVVRVPHLLGLLHPTRVVGAKPLVIVELSVGPGADLARAREIVLVSGAKIGTRARAALVALDADGAHFRASITSDAADARSRWLAAIAAALAEAAIPLGRPPAPAAGAPRGAG